MMIGMCALDFPLFVGKYVRGSTRGCVGLTDCPLL